MKKQPKSNKKTTPTKKTTKTKTKSTKNKKASTKKVPRNSSALAAKKRGSGGPMKDRRAPKGGAKNVQKELTLENELSKLATEDTQLPPEIANAISNEQDDTELEF